MTDFLKEPFVLVCFDHHTDMQKPMVEGMTSCGDWAGQVLRENTYLQQLVLIGPPQRDIDGIEIGKTQTQSTQTKRMQPEKVQPETMQTDRIETDKLLTFSEEELQNDTAKAKVAQIKEGLPFYISIDKDVLSRRFTETNRNQGDMPLPEYLEAEEINGETNVELYRYVKSHMIAK